MRFADTGDVSVSPQDKPYWVEVASEKERDFVQRVLPALGFKANLNPAKEQDPYSPDLVVEGHLADLKCQRTPFFQAEERFGIDPRYAVTFNRKHYERYCDRYPSLDIYFSGSIGTRPVVRSADSSMRSSEFTACGAPRFPSSAMRSKLASCCATSTGTACSTTAATPKSRSSSTSVSSMAGMLRSD